jgi:hypothetical protein
MVTIQQTQASRRSSPQIHPEISRKLSLAIAAKDGTRVRNILFALQRIDPCLAVAMVLRAKCRTRDSFPARTTDNKTTIR